MTVPVSLWPSVFGLASRLITLLSNGKAPEDITARDLIDQIDLDRWVMAAERERARKRIGDR